MIVSEIQITYNPEVKDQLHIRGSADAADILRNIWSDSLCHRESFYALYLNRAQRLLGYHLISLGGSVCTVADVKIIFQVALKAHANSLIVAHNHPSGNRVPSNNDLSLTRKIKEAGNLLDIHLLDHIIMLPDGYVSFGDEGIL